MTIVELIGLCVAQIIAGSSNLYSLYSGLPKRCAYPAVTAELQALGSLPVAAAVTRALPNHVMVL